MQALLDRMKSSGWQSCEKALKNLRIKTTYNTGPRDSKEKGAAKPRSLRIKGFGRQPVLNGGGTPKLTNNKVELIYDATGEPGKVKDLIFLQDLSKMISVKDYFFQSEFTYC